jgi:hypothetical protein
MIFTPDCYYIVSRVVSLVFTYIYRPLIVLIATGPIALRRFWKENEHKLLALARVARDVLSIPATGAGVEQLFNSAQDACRYRRGSLSPTIIQEFMMFMCTSKFEAARPGGGSCFYQGTSFK